MSTFTRGVFRIRDIFFHDRSAFGELCMATLTLLLGIWVSLPFVSLGAPAFSLAIEWWSEETWGLVFILCGGVHFAGVFFDSREVTRNGALGSAAAYGTLLAAVLLQDTTTPWVVFLPLHCIYCAWLHVRWRLPEYCELSKRPESNVPQ